MLTGVALTRFQKKLLTWFAEFQRDLPWRRTKDPYCIWLSEIMLQQTRVAAVIPYYERFLQQLPDVKALAEAPEQEVLRLWAGLGYYSRARNLQKAAQQIVADHDSRFPETAAGALGLSGIGPYTAAAVLSIAYGRELAVLDGNVARVIARLGAIRGDLRIGSRWQQLQKTADDLLAPKAPGDWNQAMMELGATICTPRSPQCLLCPVAEFCEARKLGLADVIPEKRSKGGGVEITLAAVVLVDPKGRTLLLPPKSVGITHTEAEVAALLSGMWHFPTIRVRRHAEKEICALIKRWGIAGRKLRLELQSLPPLRHAVTYRQITVLAFRLELATLPQIERAQLLPMDDLVSVPISNLTKKVARAALLPQTIAGKTARAATAALRF
jgi:A/G-specific adenine glycosylase